jgi:hypothetical protein
MELSSGRALKAPHPDHIVRLGRMVAVEEDAGLLDVVAALHITSIRSLSGPPHRGSHVGTTLAPAEGVRVIPIVFRRST